MSTRPVQMIDAEVIAIIKNPEVWSDVKLILASAHFADGEGISRFSKGQLARWLAMPGHRRAKAWFVESRIAALIEQGVLAPGSTPTELRSMVAYGQEEEK